MRKAPTSSAMPLSMRRFQRKAASIRRLAAVSVPWAFSSTPAGSACCNLLCHRSKLFASGSLDEDAVDTPGFPGRQLRSPDVHQDGVRTHLRRVWNQAAHHVVPGVVVDQQSDAVSNSFSQPACHPYRIRVIDVLNAFACRRIADDGVRVVCLGNHVDPDQRNGLGRGLAAGGNHRVIFDAGAYAQCVGQPGKPGNDRLGQPAGRGDFEIILSGQRFHGRMEGACRRIARQIDGHDGGIAQRHGKEDHAEHVRAGGTAAAG